MKRVMIVLIAICWSSGLFCQTDWKKDISGGYFYDYSTDSTRYFYCLSLNNNFTWNLNYAMRDKVDPVSFPEESFYNTSCVEIILEPLGNYECHGDSIIIIWNNHEKQNSVFRFIDSLNLVVLDSDLGPRLENKILHRTYTRFKNLDIDDYSTVKLRWIYQEKDSCWYILDSLDYENKTPLKIHLEENNIKYLDQSKAYYFD